MDESLLAEQGLVWVGESFVSTLLTERGRLWVIQTLLAQRGLVIVIGSRLLTRRGQVWVSQSLSVGC